MVSCPLSVNLSGIVVAREDWHATTPLSGPFGVAESHCICATDLHSNCQVSAGGDVWTEEPNKASGRFSTKQYRGGTGARNAREFQQFLGHARGSLYEVETQITIATGLAYMSSEESTRLLTDASNLGRVINALIASLRPDSSRSPGRARTTDN